MHDLDKGQIWFIAGSQHLYGDEPLAEVAAHADRIVAKLNDTTSLPSIEFVSKPVVTTEDEVRVACLEATRADDCIGVIFWMHTFSPARMWISGLKILSKPWLHLHTQFNRGIPWGSIDMDFMNLNQSAHGGREFGHIATKMGLRRKIVVGHWEDDLVHSQIDDWVRSTLAWNDAQGAKIARFGDNMRDVAVTDGDKVSAQMRFGWSVNGFGMGDLTDYIAGVSESEVSDLEAEYASSYAMPSPGQESNVLASAIRDAARIEIGMRQFLRDGRFKAFTTTFENLHGLSQLPGLAVQRLMSDGYGFGAEGDWKTAGLVRAMKVMGHGLPGGASFMEDYTYHMDPNAMLVLGAHMLEVCPSLATEIPSLEVHPLSIGSKSDPARLVFDAAPGPAVNVCLVDLGERFRLIVNPISIIAPPAHLPRLPVARAVWKPRPDLATAAHAWILAGGAHHTALSTAVGLPSILDLADIAGVECVVIREDTSISDLQKELRWNDAYYHLKER